ncbi:uncharacterized protein E0L32_011738 [Thyridium curvatum]|uniref:Uncharacterized protein n=1 Tax=Thyridium curvatum TaxID=1093900 RepID=A0A507BFU0_9PEZI|nr:uncharacterized protein E0L32_011738 [Thyridium curvatum]TPX18363.1 hypothetical protein E0L32_011738 [Thyridium curvatum]
MQLQTSPKQHQLLPQLLSSAPPPEDDLVIKDVESLSSSFICFHPKIFCPAQVDIVFEIIYLHNLLHSRGSFTRSVYPSHQFEYPPKTSQSSSMSHYGHRRSHRARGPDATPNLLRRPETIRVELPNVEEEAVYYMKHPEEHPHRLAVQQIIEEETSAFAAQQVESREENLQVHSGEQSREQTEEETREPEPQEQSQENSMEEQSWERSQSQLTEQPLEQSLEQAEEDCPELQPKGASPNTFQKQEHQEKPQNESKEGQSHDQLAQQPEQQLGPLAIADMEQHPEPDEPVAYIVQAGRNETGRGKAVPDHMVAVLKEPGYHHKCADHHSTWCSECAFDGIAYAYSLKGTHVVDAALRARAEAIFPELDPVLTNVEALRKEPGQTTRYIPQWDINLIGPYEYKRISPDFDQPESPKTPDALKTFFCKDCRGLTWLCSSTFLEESRTHPSHHCAYNYGMEAGNKTNELSGSGTARSILVQAIGLPLPAKSSANGGAGLGLFFGPESEHNCQLSVLYKDLFSTEGGPVPDRPFEKIDDNNGPTLLAVSKLLLQMRDTVAPEHRVRVDAVTEGNMRHARIKARRVRLIIETDSEYIVDLFTKHWGTKYVEKNKQNPTEQPSAKATQDPVPPAGQMDENNPQKHAGGQQDAAPENKKHKKKKQHKKKKKSVAEKEATSQAALVHQEVLKNWGYAARKEASEASPDSTRVIWDTRAKRVIPNNSFVLGIVSSLMKLREVGITVSWYLVPSEHVKEARYMAKKAVQDYKDWVIQAEEAGVE